MLKDAPLYMNRAEAINALKENPGSNVSDALIATLEDPFWGIRKRALRALKGRTVADTSLLKNRMIWMAQKDGKSSVRAEALSMLTSQFSADLNVRGIVEGAMKDRSYAVLGSALKAISGYDEVRALELAKAAEPDAGGSLVSAIASLYAKRGGPEQFSFFMDSYDRISDPNKKYVFVQIFGKYLMKQDFITQAKGLKMLEDVGLNEGAWWMRLSAIQVLSGMRQKAETSDDPNALELVEGITKVMDRVRETETNGMIKGMIGD